jgi:hypothetical protein
MGAQDQERPFRVMCRSWGTPFGPASPFASASCLRGRHHPPLRTGRDGFARVNHTCRSGFSRDALLMRHEERRG